MRAVARRLQAGACEGALERNEAANEGVVAAVGRISESRVESAVETVLRIIQTDRNVEAELDETGAADRDE